MSENKKENFSLIFEIKWICDLLGKEKKVHVFSVLNTKKRLQKSDTNDWFSSS